MTFKAPAIEIPDDDPFLYDSLNRRESAEILTQLLSSIEEPFVLAVESHFGSGKTTFIRMWKKQLSQKSFPVLYFNAWETDFTGDALISFVGEMASQMKSFGTATTKARYFSKAKELAGMVAKRSLPVALKITTAGVLDLDQITERALGDFAATYAKERIDSYESDKNTIKGFRESLEAFIKDLTSSSTSDAKTVIVFVDDLDRCRPSYALELLEKIKHFFNVKGLIFVLAIDKNQMCHSMRSLYGVGMDVDGYLRRFIDLEYRLPRASNEQFCKSLCQRFGFESFFKGRTGDSQYDERNFVETFSKLSEVFNLSLRVQEQIFSHMSIVLRTIKPNHYIYPVLLATLLILKASAPDLYRNFIDRKCDAREVLDFIKKSPGGADFFIKDRTGRLVEAHLIAATHDETELRHIADQYRNKAENDKGPKDNREAARDISGFLAHLAGRDWEGMLDYLAKNIELADRFA